MLKVENVSKAFSSHLALDNVSLQVPRGSIYGLLGPNGAGKTTLIRIINHITAPDTGTVTFDGQPLTAKSVKNIGYLPEERGLYKKMKVGEQVLFFARLKGMSQAEATRRIKGWFERLEIGDWWNKKVDELSKGMAQKVQFVITVLHEPQLLIFDEPFSGFDPINANLLKREILQLRDKGTTIIFSTHNMESVEELCDNITLINKSKNILSGSVDDVRARYGNNMHRLSFVGDTDAVADALSPIATVTITKRGTEGSASTITLGLNDNTLPNDVLRNTLDVAQITSFNPIVPSMNDIFLQAVSNVPSPNAQ